MGAAIGSSKSAYALAALLAGVAVLVAGDVRGEEPGRNGDREFVVLSLPDSTTGILKAQNEDRRLADLLRQRGAVAVDIPLQQDDTWIVSVPRVQSERIRLELQRRYPDARMDTIRDVRNLIEPLAPGEVIEAPLQNRLNTLREAAGTRSVAVARVPLSARALLDSVEENSLESLGPLFANVPGGRDVSFSDLQPRRIDDSRIELRGSGERGSRISVLAVTSKESDEIELVGTYYAGERVYRMQSVGPGLMAYVEMEDIRQRSDHPSAAALAEFGVLESEDRNSFFADCDPIADDTLVTIGWVMDGASLDELLSGRPLTGATMVDLGLGELKQAVDAAFENKPHPYRFNLVPLLDRAFRPGSSQQLLEDEFQFRERKKRDYINVWDEAKLKGADIILMVGSYPKEPGEKPYCGLAGARHAVIDLQCLQDDRKVVAHEIGHVFGGNHDSECCPCGARGPDYRFDWRSGTEGTLLAAWDCTPKHPLLATRHLQYSELADPPR